MAHAFAKKTQKMFCGKRPEEWRALYADVYDWGADRGREIIKE